MQAAWQGLVEWPWWPPLTFSTVVGGLPLLAYPVVALVAVMALGSPTVGGGPLLLVLASHGFYLGALLYPVVYLGCVITAFSTRAHNSAAPLVGAMPLLYLLGLGALLVVWWAAERRLAG